MVCDILLHLATTGFSYSSYHLSNPKHITIYSTPVTTTCRCTAFKYSNHSTLAMGFQVLAIYNHQTNEFTLEQTHGPHSDSTLMAAVNKTLMTELVLEYHYYIAVSRRLMISWKGKRKIGNITIF